MVTVTEIVMTKHVTLTTIIALIIIAIMYYWVITVVLFEIVIVEYKLNYIVTVIEKEYYGQLL